MKAALVGVQEVVKLSARLAGSEDGVLDVGAVAVEDSSSPPATVTGAKGPRQAKSSSLRGGVM